MINLYKFMPLNNGFKIPVLGYSASQKDVKKSLLCAIDAGYRYIECSAINDNESTVGFILKMKIENGGLAREDFCISSKLFYTDYLNGNIRTKCKQSLQNLGVTYLDLYFIDWSESQDVKSDEKFCKMNGLAANSHDSSLEVAWREMEKLVDAGLVKSIGFSNFTQPLIERIIKMCYIKPVMLQIDSSINNLNQALVDYAHSYGIQVTSIKTQDALLGNECSPVLPNETVLQIAKSHHKSPGQILIRHALQRELIVLINTTDPEQIRFSLNVFDFKLTKDEMERLNDSGKPNR